MNAGVDESTDECSAPSSSPLSEAPPLHTRGFGGLGGVVEASVGRQRHPQAQGGGRHEAPESQMGTVTEMKER